MLKYTLRYAPLFLLALTIIPLRMYAARTLLPTKTPGLASLSPYGPGSALYSVAMLSADDVWAVGGSFRVGMVQASTRLFPFSPRSTSATAQPLSEPSSGMIWHYNGEIWQKDVQPQPLFSVSLDTPTDGWAAGYGGTLLHYDGQSWSKVAGPVNFNKNIYSIDMLSAVNGWAVGIGGAILHYDGKQWTLISSHTQVDLYSVVMVSAQEGWAVGDGGTILHYSQGIWSNVQSPVDVTLRSISMLSPDEGWAVGDKSTIVHLRDGVWERVYPAAAYQGSSYEPANFYGIVMNTVRSGWIVGDQRLLAYRQEAWVEAESKVSIFSANGAVKATELVARFNLYSTTISSSGEGWAVGSIDGQGDGSGSIGVMHYQRGSWYQCAFLQATARVSACML